MHARINTSRAKSTRRDAFHEQWSFSIVSRMFLCCAIFDEKHCTDLNQLQMRIRSPGAIDKDIVSIGFSVAGMLTKRTGAAHNEMYNTVQHDTKYFLGDTILDSNTILSLRLSLFSGFHFAKHHSSSSQLLHSQTRSDHNNPKSEAQTPRYISQNGRSLSVRAPPNAKQRTQSFGTLYHLFRGVWHPLS